jgi:hypothetical protein
MMQYVKLSGVKQDRYGITCKVSRVDSSGDPVADEQALDFLEFDEVTAPDAPATNAVRIYAEDNGSGKTRLVARFASGANVVIATQA